MAPAAITGSSSTPSDPSLLELDSRDSESGGVTDHCCQQPTFCLHRKHRERVLAQGTKQPVTSKMIVVLAPALPMETADGPPPPPSSTVETVAEIDILGLAT
jgi:hypothetical protein